MASSSSSPPLRKSVSFNVANDGPGSKKDISMDQLVDDLGITVVPSDEAGKSSSLKKATPNVSPKRRNSSPPPPLRSSSFLLDVPKAVSISPTPSIDGVCHSMERIGLYTPKDQLKTLKQSHPKNICFSCESPIATGASLQCCDAYVCCECMDELFDSNYQPTGIELFLCPKCSKPVTEINIQ